MVLMFWHVFKYKYRFSDFCLNYLSYLSNLLEKTFGGTELEVGVK